jgi:chromosome segregation ATPase
VAANIENDIARQTMLATDASALIESAKEQLALLQQEQAQQDAVVARYEAEARRTASEMQRKQAQVDALNRKIEAVRQKLAVEGVR